MLKVLASFFIASFFLKSTDAAIVISNLLNVPYLEQAVTSSRYVAQKITTDDQALIVDSLTVNARKFGSSVNVFVNIQTDNLNKPSGTSIGSFNTATIPTSLLFTSNALLSPQASILLQANTDYWIVMSADASKGAWKTTADLSSLVSLSFGDAAYSLNAGESWSYFTLPPVNFLASIEATPVPEVDSFIVLFGCFFFAAFLHSKKNCFFKVA